MKKLLFLLFAAAALISCETEPLDPSLNSGANGGTGTGTGGGNVDAALIVGSWLYTDFETVTTTTTTLMGNTSSVTASLEFVSSDLIFTFNADGTYTSIGDITSDTFAFGMSLGNQTQTVNDSGTYTITGNTIVFTSSSPSGAPISSADTTTTIEVLNATDLSFELTGSSTQNTGGAVIVTDVDGFVDLVRQ